MGPQAKAFIGKFTLSVAIPCMSVYGLTNNLTRDLLVQSGSFLLVPLLGTVVITILSLLVGRLLKLPRKKLGVFMMMCSVSNAIFVGLAMCTELFGDTCTPYVMLYYLINTSFVQLLFLSLVRWSGESRGFDLKMLQKFLTTPAVIAVFVGLALVWFEVRLPSLVMSYCRYMNNLVTPLALLLTGYIIHDIGLKNVRLDRDLGIAMIFRFLLAPAALGRAVQGVRRDGPCSRRAHRRNGDAGRDADGRRRRGIRRGRGIRRAGRGALHDRVLRRDSCADADFVIKKVAKPLF